MSRHLMRIKLWGSLERTSNDGKRTQTIHNVVLMQGAFLQSYCHQNISPSWDTPW
jgi:hypothetical protein